MCELKNVEAKLDCNLRSFVTKDVVLSNCDRGQDRGQRAVTDEDENYIQQAVFNIYVTKLAVTT